MATRENLQRNQLNGARVLATTGHFALETAMKRALGFANPPTWEHNDRFTPETEAKADPAAREFVETDPVNLHAGRVIFALTGLDNKTHEVTNNARLSPAGRTDALKEPRVAMIKAITAAAADVAAHGQERNARKDAFYGSTPLASGDMVGALQDRHVIDHYLAQPLSKRMQSIAQMTNGQDGRTLEALVRSPVPLEANEAAMIKGAWHKAVDQRQPAKAAELKAALANQSWAETVIQQAAQYAPRLSGLSPAEFAEAAGSGAHLFNGTAADHAA
jgi:hypothetical protein